MNIYCFSTLSFAKLQFKSVINKAFHKHGVASFTDAWIETFRREKVVVRGQSHLLQMRGLKRLHTLQWYGLNKSHLLQMRGLKPNCNHIPNINYSRIFYRCVDWNGFTTAESLETKSRIFYRCVDWNSSRCAAMARFWVASFTDAWIETF